MIKVDVCRKNGQIQSITMQGHAGYADAGLDLVCAGASSISVGMMNALDILVQDTCDLQLKESYTSIKVIRDSNEVQLLLAAMLLQLSTMEETYPTYIKINEQEV